MPLLSSQVSDILLSPYYFRCEDLGLTGADGDQCPIVIGEVRGIDGQ